MHASRLLLSIVIMLGFVLPADSANARPPEEQFGVTSRAAPAVTLKQAASLIGIELGGHGSPWEVSSNPLFKQLLQREYNLYMTDCPLCWNHTRPTQTTFYFETMDQLAGQAKSAGMRVQAHHLLWGYAGMLPDWLTKGSFTKQKLRDIVKSHIQTIVARYRLGSGYGRIYEWSVVNEIFGSGFDGKNFFIDKLEDDPLHPTYVWAEDAFRWAHEADPTAKLFLNDFYYEFGGQKADMLYNLVKSWKLKGVPIDGIGMQMHIWGQDFEGNQMDAKMSALGNTIRRFRSLGLAVYVTEFDVDMRYVTGPGRLDFQGQIYRRVIATCLDNGVKSISFMGLTDAYSWLEETSDWADPTLFDDDFKKKPAYFQVLAELNQRVPVYYSFGANDGWILESSESSSVGGSLSSTASTFRLGDNLANKQLRSVLSFNTAGLPDTAVVSSGKLSIRKAGIAGTDPFDTLGRIYVDIQKGVLSGSASLQVMDFQAPATKLAALSINNAPTSLGWYSASLPASALAYINRTGPTQFRLRFSTDDNNNGAADYLSFYSGNAVLASRPVLLLKYYVP